MSEATDFLRKWIQNADLRAPSLTRATCQRWPGIGTPPNFKPGIASYGWGIDGRIMRDGAGAEVGLAFPNVWVWFSDRGLDLLNAPPGCGQQFARDQSDNEAVYLTLAGDAVQLRNVLKTWHTEFSVTTTMFDAASQQLIFSVPGAGPNAPRALMLLSLADTGTFNWTD